MPRVGRIIPPEGFLHVICRANNHRKIFHLARDYQAYCLLIQKLKISEAVKILHYCLMSNHIHFLVGLVENSNLARFIKKLSLRYYHIYKKRYIYDSHLWHGRFKSKIIDKESYLIQCGKYIELNPVRANLVRMPEDFAFSSYRHYAFGVIDKIVDDDPCYLDLHPNPLVRQKLYQKLIIDEIEALDNYL